ncbi:MAG: hypothetical protein HC905_13745, partial [Bacteroidales bacterium]|nr:hypothetical protein [Bacteroidales bacterium]
AKSNLEDYEVDSALMVEINKYANLDLVLADTKEKIASVEFYPEIDSYSYYDWNDVFHEDKDANLAYRFVFANGSTGDLEAYFGDGFDAFFNDLNGFILDLNDKYDLGLEEIEYGNE